MELATSSPALQAGAEVEDADEEDGEDDHDGVGDAGAVVVWAVVLLFPKGFGV